MSPADRSPFEATPEGELDAYLPRWVRERLLHAADAADAADQSWVQHVEAAVLLVDIVGFKALTEKLTQTGSRGAEALRSVLNRYFGEVSSLVSAHGGDTATFAGDALLAFWQVGDAGAKAACLAAARCALEVRDAVSKLEPEFSSPLRQRLAVDFGSLSLLEVQGADARRFALLAGEPLVRVASACRAASPEAIRVARSAWQLLSDDAVAVAAPGAAAGDNGATLASVRAGLPLLAPTPLARLADETLARYLPRNLVERLRSGQGEWLAEFRTLSIVFVNLGELDTAAFNLPARLEAALATAQAIEAKTGGAIYQFLMDDKGVNLILAYGLPLYHQEDDAARAVEAALALSGALRNAGFVPAIGVATGQSFCGNCGEERRQYSIIGSPINRAARLMQDAGGDVLFDDATAQATAGHFEFETSPHGLRRAQRRTTPPPRVPSDGALVGRDQELKGLFELLSELQLGRGCLVLIEGEPGVGKSRLIGELCDASAQRGFGVLQGAATSLEQGTPYYFWREPLKQLLGLPASAGAAELGQCLLTRLVGHRELTERAPLLADVLPLKLAETDLSRQTTGVARVAAIHELLIHLLAQAAAERPTLFVLDDLHCIDPSSLEALAAVVQRAPQLLLVGTSRPHSGPQASPHQALTKHAQQALQLEALSRDAVERLIAQKLGATDVPDALLAFAFERTLGHPLFCEELVLSLRDSGAITVSGGVCDVPEAALERATTKIPDTLQGVIVSRIDRLPSEQQLAIKVAGVIGPRFSPRLLADIYPIKIDADALQDILLRLVASDLLQVAVTGSETYYRFKHVIAQESVAELVLFAQRRDLHARVARWLEANHGPDSEPHVAELALHWELADEVERAIGYLERTGEMALQRYANSEAVKALRRAFDLCQSHGFNPSTERRAHWEALIGHAWHELSDSVRSSEHFTRALSLHGHRVAQSRLQVGLGVGKQLIIQLCRRLGIWRPGLDASRAEAAHMFARLSEHWYFENDSFRVLYATLCSLNHAEASSSRRVVDGFGAMAVGLGIAGMDRLAGYYSKHSILRAEQLGTPADRAYAQLLAGVYAAGKAAWSEMTIALESASTIYKRLGDPFRWQQSRSILCFGALVRGDHELVELLLGEIDAAASQMAFVQVNAWTWSARMALALANDTGVGDCVEQFGAIPTKSLPVSERVLCLGLLAEAQLRSGAASAALESANAALSSMLLSPPTAWHLVPGVGGIAETYLGLLERGELSRSEQLALRAKARLASQAITEFSRRSLACRPLALRVKARLMRVEGRAHQAEQLALQSLRSARKLSLARDERLAELELARTGLGARISSLGSGGKEHDG